MKKWLALLVALSFAVSFASALQGSGNQNQGEVQHTQKNSDSGNDIEKDPEQEQERGRNSNSDEPKKERQMQRENNRYQEIDLVYKSAITGQDELEPAVLGYKNRSYDCDNCRGQRNFESVINSVPKLDLGNSELEIVELLDELDISEARMTKLEQQMQSRNTFMRFIAGGDHEAAQEMEQERIRNMVRIQEMKNQLQKCNCSSQIKDQLKAQIQILEQHQYMHQEMAKEEQNYGMFGWIWH